MKKIWMILPALTLLFAGCTDEGISNTSSATNPSSSVSSSTSSTPSRPTFTTLTDLMDYVAGEGIDQEIASATKYERNSKAVDVSLLTTTTTITEEGHAYADDVLYVSGHQKVESVDEYFPELNETEEDDYEFLAKVIDDTLYQVTDYATGKDNDSARKDAVSAFLPGQVELITSTNVISKFVSFYEAYFASRVVAGFDDIVPTRNEYNEEIYRHAEKWNENLSGYQFENTASFTLAINASGQISEFTCEYECLGLEDGSLIGTPVESYSENFVITYGEKVESSDTLVPLNPLDYFLTDYTPTLYWYDELSSERYEVEATSFPYDCYLEAVAGNTTPEKALDTDLTVIDSSNEEVIKIITYTDGDCSVKAIGVGTSTLTVRSESGITKTIDVTVVAPAIDEILLNIPSTHMYVGETDFVILIAEPSNSLQIVALRSSDNVKISKDEEGDYFVTYLSEGPAYIEAYVEENPSMSKRFEFVIEKALTREEIIDSIYGTWTGDLPDQWYTETIEDAVTITFTKEVGSEEGTYKGTFTLNKEGTGFTFEVGKAYEFDWKIEPALGENDIETVEISISTISFSTDVFDYVYDNNHATFDANGTSAHLDLQFSDPDYWTFWLSCDLSKVTA